MTLKKRADKYEKAFRTSFEVVNMNSGHVVSFRDDGSDRLRNPVGGRVGALEKFAMQDEDGDPVFVIGERDATGAYVFKGWPKNVLENDASSNVRISTMARTVNDASRNPKFKTLGEKATANRKAHEARQRDYAERQTASKTLQVQMPPELIASMKHFADLAVKQAEKDNRKGVTAVARS